MVGGEGWSLYDHDDFSDLRLKRRGAVSSFDLLKNKNIKSNLTPAPPASAAMAMAC